MGDDTTQNTAQAPQNAGGEPETPSQSGTQQTDQTAVASKEGSSVDVRTQQKIERTIPYGRFAEQNKALREAQRRLAELENRSKYSQYNPQDTEVVMSHPIVQELMLKNAKHELNDYTKDLLENYPMLHPQVKKAILANVRGWVKETTTDVETAKIDIAEMVENLIAESQTAPQPQTFQVSQTNAGITQPGTKPADVMNILNKPIDEIDDNEGKILRNYRKGTK